MPLRKLTVTIEELPDENTLRPTPDLEPGGAGDRPRPEQGKQETDAIPDPPPRKPPE
jgi:hypothetical protein